MSKQNVRDNEVFQRTQLDPARLEDRLRQRFDAPFRCYYMIKPNGHYLHIQNLETKKVSKIRPPELESSGDPFSRICDRIISRIQRGEYDN